MSRRYDSNQEGRTEIIAACGFNETTTGDSFTRVLVGELKRMARLDADFDQPVSALQLHGRMLESMRHQHLPDSDDPGMLLRSDHYFSTPVYMSLTRDYSLPSIPLKRFRHKVPRSRSSSFYDDPRQHRQAEQREVQELREPGVADPRTPPHSLRSPTQADESDFGNREIASASYIAIPQPRDAIVLDFARQVHQSCQLYITCPASFSTSCSQ
jgi:hypothetical protein